MTLFDILDGLNMFCSGMMDHPKFALGTVAGGIALIVGVNNYTEWRTPYRARALQQHVVAHEHRFAYEEAKFGVLRDKSVQNEGVVSSDQGGLRIEFGRHQDRISSALTRGQVYGSYALIDKVPLGSPDILETITEHTIKGKHSTQQPLVSLSESYRNQWVQSYQRLVRDAHGQLPK